MASRLSKFMIENHTFKFNSTNFWPNSKTVLSWAVSGVSSKFKAVVAYRVAELVETTAVKDCCWISTKENITDETTKSSYTIDWSINTQ